MWRAGYPDGGCSHPCDPPLENVYPEGFLIGAGGAIKGAVGLVDSLASTTLYRAVSQAERADLSVVGAFRNIAGIESKYFSTTLEGALQYSNMAAKAFGDTLTVVRTSIPTRSIVEGMRVTVDRGIPAVVVPTSKSPQLAAPRLVP